MIETRIIDELHKNDVKLKNCSFDLNGRMLVSRTNGEWKYDIEKLPESDVSRMTFPDEDYDYDEMVKSTIFIGAYDGDKCVGLLILQSGFFKYMYIYDLKVNSDYRRKGVATKLIDHAGKIATEKGKRGLYLQAQDNNLGACCFYISAGFRIGGLDTDVYIGTKQEGKADIIFYKDCFK